jgi:hypothetical protein
MASSSAYAIVVCLVVAIAVAVAVYYYMAYKLPSMSTWVIDGLQAGCTTAGQDVYGIPTSFIVRAALLKI